MYRGGSYSGFSHTCNRPEATTTGLETVSAWIDEFSSKELERVRREIGDIGESRCLVLFFGVHGACDVMDEELERRVRMAMQQLGNGAHCYHYYCGEPCWSSRRSKARKSRKSHDTGIWCRRLSLGVYLGPKRHGKEDEWV